MQQATVFSCVRVINDAIATVPLKLYRREGRARIEVSDHPLAAVLSDAPNGLQTSVEFRDMLQSHLGLRGNGFAHVRRDNRGHVVAIVPIHPDGLTVRLLDGRLYYEGTTLDRRRIIASQDEVLHVRGFGGDGLFGYSPIRECRETVGLALTLGTYSHSLFTKGANPGGVLQLPAGIKLSREAAARLRDSFDASYAGAAKTGRTLLLEDGLTWQRVGLSAVDAQFLELSRFKRSDIAGIFRVPPHMVGDLERATFSNIEQQAIDFVQHCIRPWAERWEARLDHTLLTPAERASGLYIRHNLDGLLRGDQKSRFESYAIGRQWGFLSADDCRMREELEPLPDGKGEIYLQPANMIEAGEAPTAEQSQSAAPNADPSYNNPSAV